MKKLLSLLLACAMLCACSAAPNNNSEENIMLGVSAEIIPLAENMPEPFDMEANSGGDELNTFYGQFEFRFSNINSTLMALVDKEELEKWIAEYETEKLSDPFTEQINVYGFIKRFNISKETLIEAINASDNTEITVDDVELLYSSDVNKILEGMVNKSAILKNGKIYTPYWIYLASADDYKKAGIEKSEIEACYEKLKNFPFKSEARTAFEAKLEKF